MLSKNASLVYGILATTGLCSAAELIKRSGISQSAISRALNEIDNDKLVSYRDGRTIFYGLVKHVRSLPANIPIYQANNNEEGGSRSKFIGNLIAIEGGSDFLFFMPNGKVNRYEGLPWFLQDLRPQGYIGRRFCLEYAKSLNLSANLDLWDDEDILFAIHQYGSDLPGNVIVGDISNAKYLREHENYCYKNVDIGVVFDKAAKTSVSDGNPGSSAAGEHPKFLMRRWGEQGDICNVLVKFSPELDGSPAADRWKDLLISEHLALETLYEAGLIVPKSRVVLSQKRCYLEMQRYDRTGVYGREPVVSFGVIDDAFIGARKRWSDSAERLLSMGMIRQDHYENIVFLEQFGRLIGNTDMHFGNLSFYWDGFSKPKLELAPVYDMLPMLYAPIRSEVVERSFDVDPYPDREAAKFAVAFWDEVSGHPDISPGFKEIARSNAEKIMESAPENSPKV